MHFKLFRNALAFLGLATATYAAPQPVTAPAGHPALWEVSDPDTTIYLFGTIHLLPENYTWQTRAIDKAIARSDTLFVETIVDPKNPAPLAAALAKIGFANGLPLLADRISPAKRQMLEAAIAKTGIPRPAFDRMKTWAAAFTLLGVQYKELGLQGEQGVEQTLKDRFGAAGKPIGELETNAQQLGFFDALPESAQRALLEGSVEPPETATADFTEMLRGWANGDVAAIARTFNHDLADSPPLRQTLLEQRNRNWSRWIEQRLSQPGTVMVAVGAGHLAGADSVQSLLQRDGYKVRRLQ